MTEGQNPKALASEGKPLEERFYLLYRNQELVRAVPDNKEWGLVFPNGEYFPPRSLQNYCGNLTPVEVDLVRGEIRGEDGEFIRALEEGDFAEDIASEFDFVRMFIEQKSRKQNTGASVAT
jgi:hypothetical protein